MTATIASERAVRRARVSPENRARWARKALEDAEQAILADSQTPVSPERWARLRRAFCARGAAWRVLADVTSDELGSRAMLLAGRADSDRAQRMAAVIR